MKKRPQTKNTHKTREIVIVIGGILMLLFGVPLTLSLIERVKTVAQDRQKFEKIDTKMMNVLTELRGETEAGWEIEKSCYPHVTKFGTEGVAGCEIVIATQTPANDLYPQAMQIISNNGFTHKISEYWGVDYFEYSEDLEPGSGPSLEGGCSLSIDEVTDPSPQVIEFRCSDASSTEIYPLVIEE